MNIQAKTVFNRKTGLLFVLKKKTNKSNNGYVTASIN